MELPKIKRELINILYMKLGNEEEVIKLIPKCIEYYLLNKKVIDEFTDDEQALLFSDYIINLIIEYEPIYYLTKDNYETEEINTEGIPWNNFYKDNILPIRVKFRINLKPFILNKLNDIKKCNYSYFYYLLSFLF